MRVQRSTKKKHSTSDENDEHAKLILSLVCPDEEQPSSPLVPDEEPDKELSEKKGPDSILPRDSEKDESEDQRDVKPRTVYRVAGPGASAVGDTHDDDEEFQDGSYRPGNNQEEPSLVTAKIVSDGDDIKDQIRKEIFAESVEAEAVKSPCFTRNRCIVLITLLLLACILAVVFSLRSRGTNNTLEPTASPFSQNPTTSPTERILSPQEEQVLDLLLPISPRILEVGSSQQEAFNWILETNRTQINNTVTVVEDYILALLYYALDGPSWTDSLGFLAGSDSCEWNQENPSGQGPPLGAFCNDDGNVAVIRLLENNLIGSLPDEIGFFPSLNELHIEGNQVSGTLPTTLGFLSNLQIVAASGNALSGSLPTELFELTNLQALWVGSNQLNGTIPENMASATDLEVFVFQQTSISGTIPESLGEMSNLKTFVGSFNRLLGGPLPTFVNNANLTQLYLHETSISGTLPASMSNLVNLQEFGVHQTNFVGTIPTEFSNLENLALIELSPTVGIGLTGTVPPFRSMQSNLVLISFLGNSLTGSLDALFDIPEPLESLVIVDFGRNNLSGTIPSNIGSFTSLSYLDLRENELIGTVHSDLGSLEALGVLRLNSNKFVGTIPSRFGQLTGTRIIELNSNQLTGTIPTEIGLCLSLQNLQFGSNSLTGEVPLSITTLPRLESFGIGENDIQDNFTDTFCSPEIRSSFQPTISADCPQQVICTCCSFCCDSNGTCIPN